MKHFSNKTCKIYIYINIYWEQVIKEKRFNHVTSGKNKCFSSFIIKEHTFEMKKETPCDLL